MIAGSYDDMQGGICYGGIAHAGPPRFKRAMWFDGANDYVDVSFASHDFQRFTFIGQVYFQTLNSGVFRLKSGTATVGIRLFNNSCYFYFVNLRIRIDDISQE